MGQRKYEKAYKVQVAFIQVGGDDNLKSLAPHLPCQLYADLMAPLRGHLTGLETLIAMARNVLVLFAIPLLGQDHICRKAVCFRQLIEVTKEPSAVLRVFHAGDQVAEPALDMP